MIKINVANFKVETGNNNGVNKEWTLCRYYGIKRSHHDRTPYNKGSDIEIANSNISVKSSGATLMSGSCGIGCKTFEGIWRRYRKNVHSDTFVYVTNDYIAYYMNINEFSKFIHLFASLDRESSKNGGQLKIKLRNETKAMVQWLDKKAS